MSTAMWFRAALSLPFIIVNGVGQALVVLTSPAIDLLIGRNHFAD